MLPEIQRQPDELWTAYLIRKLQAKSVEVPVLGKELSDYACDAYMTFQNSELVLTRMVGKSDTIEKLDCDHTIGRTVFNNLLHAKKYDDCTAPIADFVTETVLICFDSEEDYDIKFTFGRTDNILVSKAVEEQEGKLILEGLFAKYGPELGPAFVLQHGAEEAIDDIVQFVMNPSCASRRYVKGVRPTEPMERKMVSDPRLDEIVQKMRDLHSVVTEHPLVLKGDDAYLRDLYVRTVNKDIRRLKFFDYKGRRIPFVLVHSRDLESVAGRVSGNLYFVAKDKAPQEWQQYVVAYHESPCANIGHEKAKRREFAVAQYLGHGKEYNVWREKIDSSKM